MPRKYNTGQGTTSGGHYNYQKVVKKYEMKVPTQKQGESDAAYLHRLAKNADQKLRRLEALSNQPGYENVLKYAYKNAIHDIKTYVGAPNAKGQYRFDKMAKMTDAGGINKLNYNARLNAIKRFIESPTSTKTGINKIYQSRADTINERYGTDFSWEDMEGFFNSKINEKLGTEYGSKTSLRAIGLIKRYDLKGIRDLNKLINSGRSQNLKRNDEIVKAAEEIFRSQTKKKYLSKVTF